MTNETTRNDSQPQENPYMAAVPLDRVRADALYGVRLARIAWRARDPEGAAKELGKILEPGHEHELFRLPRPAPAKTEKPVRRKVRKKATARAKAKASADVRRCQTTPARKSKKASKRRRGPARRRVRQ